LRNFRISDFHERFGRRTVATGAVEIQFCNPEILQVPAVFS